MTGRCDMKKIFLHIGAGKTGTSALQAQFAINQEALNDHGIHYPSFINDQKAKNFHITSGNAIELGNILKNKGSSKKDLEKYLLHDIKEANDRHILYSSEVMEPFDKNNMKILNEIALEKGYRIIVVYYIRSIADQAISLYHQLLKRHRNTKSFSEFIKVHNNRFLTVIQNAIDTIGKNNLIVKNYDKVKNNIFQDFLTDILNIQELNDFKIVNKKVNRSLSKFEVSLMLHMNRLLTKPEHSTFISDALIHTNPDVKYKMTIDQKDFETLQIKYQQDIEKLNTYLKDKEKPLKLIESSQIVSEDKNIELNPFQSAVFAILAEITKDIK